MEYVITKRNKNGISFVVPDINEWFKERHSSVKYTYTAHDETDIPLILVSIERRWKAALQSENPFALQGASAKEEAERVEKAFASLY